MKTVKEIHYVWNERSQEMEVVLLEKEEPDTNDCMFGYEEGCPDPNTSCLNCRDLYIDAADEQDRTRRECRP